MDLQIRGVHIYSVCLSKKEMISMPWGCVQIAGDWRHSLALTSQLANLRSRMLVSSFVSFFCQGCGVDLPCNDHLNYFRRYLPVTDATRNKEHTRFSCGIQNAFSVVQVAFRALTRCLSRPIKPGHMCSCGEGLSLPHSWVRAEANGKLTAVCPERMLNEDNWCPWMECFTIILKAVNCRHSETLSMQKEYFKQ